MDPPDPHAQRFDSLSRLYGTEGYNQLKNAHVCIIGIGGVGSWSAEALARSGIGSLTLIDLDEVCISNTNRQIHALDHTVGHPKVQVMADRIASFHPTCQIHTEQSFYTQSTATTLLDQPYTAVLDAIDNGKLKAHLIHHCREKHLPIVTIGGAGGRTDATRIQSADLAKTFNDPLLHQVRKTLRQQYDFPTGKKSRFKVPCIFSDELPLYPTPCGSVSTNKPEDTTSGMNCNTGFGTAAHVTGTFGLAAAGEVIRLITQSTP